MNFQVRRWRLVLRLLVLALVVAAVPLPCGAQQVGPTPQKPGLKASIQPAVTMMAAKPATRVKAQATTDSTSRVGSGSFFKTPAGVAVLAIVAAGAGFAVYSASHDRIHSTVPDALK